VIVENFTGLAADDFLFVAYRETNPHGSAVSQQRGPAKLRALLYVFLYLNHRAPLFASFNCPGRIIRLWHKADMLNTLTNVRFWGQHGH
jgi:hypothetical protein